ncbi:8-oxo-dGTP diphosphatase MutT [Lentisalinibacter sediminis]|uniref:8-oxo-dGTP diphosphatase MutT n=1 Tax=Lentisalinibacter sediminis TaxID=2992237 RepID=UPI0038647E53
MPRPAVVTDAPRPRLQVVAGILRDGDSRILISRRQPGKHGAGRWEFPGGKIAPGEEPLAALRRELAEEIGIEVLGARRFMALEHDYPERSVALDFHLVTGWRGRVQALERQELAWASAAELFDYDMLEADAPVLEALLRDRVG